MTATSAFLTMRQKANIANKILLLLLLMLTIPTMASSKDLDSLIYQISEKTSDFLKVPGAFNIEAYVSGHSQCDEEGLVGKHFAHLLPFQGNHKRDIAFEAIVQASYQWPGGIKFSCKTINSNNKRRSRAMLKDYYQTILPGLEIRDSKDDSSGKFHVLPFSSEGRKVYHYEYVEMTDSRYERIIQQGIPVEPSYCLISFEPIREHHTMLSGILMVDSTRLEVIGFHATGRIEFATIETDILFRRDSIAKQLLPYTNHTKIHYTYGGTEGTNTFKTYYRFKNMQSLDSIKRVRHPRLNLSETYETIEMNDADFDTIRPILLSSVVDSILYTPEVVEPKKASKKNAIFTFSEHMVEGGKFGDDNNRLKLYGPLDPATFEYDRINGFSLNERLRWNIVFRDKSSLNLSAQLGYAFKIKELRYKAKLDWTFLPKIRQGLTVSFERSNSGFSSKYVQTINQALKQKKDTIDFYGLGIDYFQRYELRMEHHTEIRTGLNIFTGLQYNYRSPVKHGKMASSVEHRQELAGQHYSDFAPYIRLEWTPRQFYYYEGRRKIYIDGQTPTFILEASKAIKGVWGAVSDYGRIEFDMTQNLRVASKRHISYRFGAGAFMNQKGEYFINYHYFTRRFYPTNWQDNRVGGIFQLLDEYWFSSSPSYVRGHVMYETPYGLIHRTMRSLSKYVIKERAYMSILGAEGKNSYTEFGYAFANNYINLGLFVGLKGSDFYKVGAKIRIELEKHL